MKHAFNGFFNGKNILVTGHTGFKGSWLCVWLKELGANVIGYSLDPYTEKDNFVLTELHEKMIDIRADIRDTKKLESVFKKYEPEVVFHLAAQPLVRLSYEIPRDTFEQNIMGTANVLECVKATDSVKVAVIITSDKCYDNREWIWGYRENDPMGGYDPYSASKGAAELVINSYINSFFKPDNYNQHQKAVASVRAGNVIGGGDWAKDRIIPDCIRAIEQKTEINIRNPFAVRPWQHVLEPLSGYLWIAANLMRNPMVYVGAWNFGPASESIITVKEIVNKILDYFPGASWMNNSENNELHEAKLLNLDCSKSMHYLKWKPALNIEQCIQLTANWYKEYRNSNVYELCANQISYYTNQAINLGILWSTNKEMV